jgi:molecular chaperone DnaK (HSP70)
MGTWIEKMNQTSRLQETIFIEASKSTVIPLIPTGRKVPAIWEQTFTTSKDDQRSFDLHLLRGVSPQLAENITIGKWRIAGIPPAVKGEHRIKIVIRVGVDGSIGVSAILKNQPLVVTFLSEMFPQIPLAEKMPDIPKEQLVLEPCPTCKSRLVIQISNWKNEPFSLCLDCGEAFELPDPLDSNETAPWKELPPELLKTLGIETPHKPGGLQTGELKELEEKGFEINPGQESDLIIDANRIIQQFPNMILGQKKPRIDLDHEEILKLAGEPIPESERKNCPKCDAVISRDAKRCEWCGFNF